jgi:anaerobic ribonucleoside-triphosphate reductase
MRVNLASTERPQSNMGNQAKDTPKTERQVPCEVYSRIVGYLRPVQDWNKGKRQEFSDREVYQVQDDSVQERAEH